MEKLNLGCGVDIREGFINVDVSPLEGVDMVHDLNEPLPFRDNSIKKVVCINVIEHIKDVESFMGEIYRVLAPGGVAEIVTPHFSHPDAWTDPQHVHYFGAFTADFWVRGSDRGYYTPFSFSSVRTRVSWFPKWYLPHHYLLTLLGRNRKFLFFYEAVLKGLFPAWSIRWEFRKGSGL